MTNYIRNWLRAVGCESIEEWEAMKATREIVWNGMTPIDPLDLLDPSRNVPVDFTRDEMAS